MDSLDDLAKSQLFDTTGRIISEPLGVGQTGAAGTNLLQKNVVIDNKYKIVSLLGEGGMGAVYKAQHLLLDKVVALKTFKTTSLSDEAWMRFQREAQSIASLNHINIVKIYDFGVGETNVPYYTMECLTGQSLAQRLTARGPLPADQALLIFHQICLALSQAHSRRIIHRDMKPANIFLTSDFTTDKVPLVKIVDFGIAGLALGSIDGQKLTTTGSIFGSPLYMSPEQSMGNKVTAQSDIYSCGCSLFQTLTGSPPFRGDNVFATTLQHQQKKIPTLEEKCKGVTFSPGLNALIESMLAKDPGQRIQSVDEVATELEKLCTKAPSRHPVMKDVVVAPLPAELTETGEIPARTAKNKIAIAIAIFVTIAAAVAVPLISHLMSKVDTPPEGQERESRAQPAVPGAIMTKSANAQRLGQSLPPGFKYLQTGDSRLMTDRTFQFPPNISIGKIEWDTGTLEDAYMRQQRILKAQGSVVVPANIHLVFEGSKAIYDNPEFFDGFGPYDLDTVHLERQEDCKWKDKHLEFMSKLSGVRSLKIDDADVTDSCVESLNKLTRLEELSARDTAISAEALKRIQRLPMLWHLTLANEMALSGCLDRIKYSKTYSLLDLVNCDLHDSDLRIFGTCPNISYLHIDGNHDVTDKGVQYICHLPRLVDLDLSHTSVTTKCIPMLQQLPQLRFIKITSDKWPAQAQAQLKAALPRCKLKPGIDATADKVNDFTDTMNFLQH